MLERFGDEAREVVSSAEAEAHQLGHERVGTEHLLLGLLSTSGTAAGALRACGATLDGCRRKVAEMGGPPGPAATADARASLGFSERAQRVVQRADRLSLRRRDPHVRPVHLLVSLLDVEGNAGQVLRGVSVDIPDLRIASGRLLDEEEPAVERPPAPSDSPRAAEPRCGACGAVVDEPPPIRTFQSGENGGQIHSVVLVYCRACGAVFGAGPVAAAASTAATRRTSAR